MATNSVARALMQLAPEGTVPDGWVPAGSPPQATKSGRGVLNMINPPQYFDEALLPRDQTVFKTPSARQAIEMLAPSAQPNGAGYGFGYTKPPAMQLIPNVQLADPSFVERKPSVVEILVNGGVKNQPSGGSGRGRPVLRGGGLVFNPTAPVGQAPVGDPWAGLRMGTQAMSQPVPGMVTGNQVAPVPVQVPRPMLGEMVRAQAAHVAATDPRRGQQIMTKNNGVQTVGQRLNNSTKGRTVTGSDWFNSVTGL